MFLVLTVSYLDYQRLTDLDGAEFRRAHPFPWVNPASLLTEAGFEALCATLPGPEQFQACFGEARKHGQRSHDRLVLDYKPGLDIESPWQQFIDELSGPEYRSALARLFGDRRFTLKFHWHYTPRGCSVSPHCDNPRKLGSHIFYFNRPGEWEPAWGGETLLLDDEGRFKRASAPEFDDFARIQVSESMGNRSLLFMRNGNSWHGVQELRCPPGLYRKVFIVVIESNSAIQRLRDLLSRAA